MKISIQKIEAALAAEDIEDLISGGAPTDEYASEAKLIARAVEEMKGDLLTEQNLVAVLSLIWKKSFGRTDKEIEERLPSFRHISQNLLA